MSIPSLIWAVLLVLVPAGSPPAALPRADDEDVAELERKLRDLSDKTDWLGYRSGAVKKLARLGTPEAWELVIGALEDIAPRCADEAQLQLGALQGPEVLEDLLGKSGLRSKDEWVRLRVAEALGRVTIEVDGEALVKALGDRQPEVRRTLLWSLERLALAGHLGGDVQRKLVPGVQKVLRKDSDPDVRGAALYALQAIEPAAGREAVLEGLGDKRESVRTAALAVGAGFSDGEELLARHADDPSLRVRTQVVRSLVDRETATAARLLVDRLEAEPEERLRWHLVAELQRLSGRKYRLDPRPWRDWAAKLPDDWKPAEGEESSPGAADLGERSVAFAGLPVISRRVCFLIDFSGSIWEEREGGGTLKEVIDVKLREALESLPEDTLFNVIPYTAQPIPWSEGLEPAKPSNVKKALEFFEGCRASGTGAFFEAAELALEDPLLDTIIVLTDGKPSGGRRWNMDLMVDLFTEKNRYRQVAYDSLLVDCPKNLQKRWSELAARTGGRSVAVEL